MRFVIQHHITENEHYDIMFETEGSDMLLTWQIILSYMDLLLKGAAIKAERIRDHRKHYLDYEGPVKSSGGSVKIFDSGYCRTLLKENDKFEFELNGKKLAGNIMLNKIDNNIFEVKYIQIEDITYTSS